VRWRERWGLRKRVNKSCFVFVEEEEGEGEGSERLGLKISDFLVVGEDEERSNELRLGEYDEEEEEEKKSCGPLPTTVMRCSERAEIFRQRFPPRRSL
jgi:hypothetical protein